MVEFQHVWVERDGRALLEDIDFEVDRGEFVSVLGLTGSGKSTLLRCIVEVVQPEQGTITVDGVDAIANNLETRRRTF